MSDELISTQLIDEPSNEVSPMISILSGCFGGIAQVITGQPFDCVKVRLQTAAPGSNSTIMTVVKDIITKEGYSAFYKGTTTPLLGIGACVSVQFGCNEFMKTYFTRLNGKGNPMSLPQYFASGVIAGVANAPLASVIEHVRIRQQINVSSNAPSAIQIMQAIYKNGALGRGILTTSIRDGFGLGCYFSFYEFLVNRQLQKYPDFYQNDRKNLESWKLCTFGGLSGIVLWSFIYPVDIVKSIKQTGPLNVKPEGIIAIFKKLHKQNGTSGFFKGIGPALIRSFPVNAATFLAFEASMRALT
ncbi:mitochondrial carrier [Hanseniaspora valbyensis NRRL Y-1626]|uniref:Mitochondrial carrier n=1 Tax=Hanseniaspora valbyensis NRRL Y-1626 TaxID=766949 RepID=A0A1B7TD92_9ASCO|nr:mitochondrial carrier [Hanseniaspora valbyensis NRRL Y-1626]